MDREVRMARSDPSMSGMPELSDSGTIPQGAQRVRRVTAPEYRYVYTTGPFTLPEKTHSLDWGLLNNDTVPQTVRVTVFKCPLGSTKSADPPGPLVVTLQPGETTHNANAAVGGFFHEIQVETNSRHVFPYAAAWPGAAGDPIAGSVVKSAEFIRHLQ
jgi:hypothetical protein